MAFLGINHVAFVTNDMEKTVRFYHDYLGLPIVFTRARTGDGQGARRYIFSVAPQNRLTFYEWPNRNLPPAKDPGHEADDRQFDHISLTVESEDDLQHLIARAPGFGVSIGNIVDTGIVKSIYMFDPNGISVEVSQDLRDLENDPILQEAVAPRP